MTKVGVFLPLPGQLQGGRCVLTWTAGKSPRRSPLLCTEASEEKVPWYAVQGGWVSNEPGTLGR